MIDTATLNMLILIAVLAVIFLILFVVSGRQKRDVRSFRDRKAEEIEIKRAKLKAREKQAEQTGSDES